MAFGLYKAEPKDWLVFILGLFTMIKARVIGTFGISELIMVYLLLFKVKDNPFFYDSKSRKLFIMAVLWGVGTAITDLYRSNTYIDSLKGLTSIIFLILILPVGYWCLYDRVERIMYYFAGLSLSAIIGFYFQKSVDLDEYGIDVWQVYAFEYLAVFIAGSFFYCKKYIIGYIILFGYGLWSLFHMSRNIFLIFILSILLISIAVHYWHDADGDEHIAIQMLRRNSVRLLLVLTVGFMGIKYSYSYMASSGMLGERAQLKYEMQNNTKMGLKSGRADFFVSLAMIQESPIFGYGSYAKDKDERAYEKFKEIGLERDVKYKQSLVRQRMIPGHSYILGAWVYNGILSVSFWIYVVYLLISFMAKGVFYDMRITPLLIIWVCMTLWNVFFSPFSDRPILAMLLTSILCILNTRQQLVNKTDYQTIYEY